MKRRTLSFRTRILIIISLFLLSANAVLGTIMLHQSKSAMKTLIQQRMLDISNSAADLLDGDALAVIEAEDRDTTEYKSIEDALKVFQDNIDLEYIYCVRKMDNGSFIFTVDPTVDDPAEFGDIVVYTEALARAGDGKAAVDEEPYSDGWGRFYSSYSPVFDSKGEVAGIVAVDFSAKWYDEQLAKHTSTILINSILTLIIGASIVIVIAKYVGRRFRALDVELSDLSEDLDSLTMELSISKFSQNNNDSIGNADNEGENDKVDANDSLDEISHLSHRINMMRDELRSYIEHMNTQANSMITALSTDYRSVYYVDIDNDQGVCYRGNPEIDNGLKEGERFSFNEIFKAYAQNYITDDYREGFLNFINPDNIRNGIKNESLISYRYLVKRNDTEVYEMIKMAGVRRAEDRTDHIVHAIGVGLTNVDKETRKSMESSRALSDALNVAEEASRAKTAFLSNMSHEIRTPLNAIIGLDSIALNDPEIPVKTKEYLEKIGDSARHLLGIINDILDMSRIESGRMTIKREEFSFPKLLEQINTIISGQCNEKGIDYKCHIKGTIDDYYIGDSMKLRQVLINILGNAVKFTPEGGEVVFNVERVAKFDGNSTIKFEMKDTGIGMDQAFLAKIFDAFSQEDSSSTNKYGSTGLGMAITKNIVDMMNGKIEVESEKGRGSSFTLTVTLSDSDKKGVESDEEIYPQEISALLVDDDPVACEHSRLVLEKVGIATTTVFSGAEAVETIKLHHARRETYNLILIDWKMPGMDGIETAKEIRKVIGNDSAIIILTAYKWDDVMQNALDAGVDSFIAKPLFASNILDEFKNAIDNKRKDGDRKEGKAELSGRRILLAEDVTVNAEIMTLVLSMREIEVDHALNGKICVEMFKSHEEGYYDAILMDMRMPEMDGLEAASLIRKLDRKDADNIPIIALTANAFDEDVQRSLQAGLNAHLTKPVEPEVLYETLESLIK